VSPEDKITASIRRASDRLAKLGTERYRAKAEGDAPRLAKVDGQIARTKARREALIKERADLRAGAAPAPPKAKVVAHGYNNWRISRGGIHLGAVRYDGTQVTSKYQWTAHHPDGKLIDIGVGAYGWGRSRKAAVERLCAWHDKAPRRAG
jgi:hypothetical protein